MAADEYNAFFYSLVSTVGFVKLYNFFITIFTTVYELSYKKVIQIYIDKHCSMCKMASLFKTVMELVGNDYCCKFMIVYR